MRVIVASALAFAAASGVNAFAPVATISNQHKSTLFAEVCDIDTELANNVSPLVGVRNSANAIRSAIVTNADGDFVRVDDAIKSASSVDSNAPQVVIYLRHMG